MFCSNYSYLCVVELGRDYMMYRKYINIVEAANKGCPIATYDLEVNVKNRQTAIDNHHYGPANPNQPDDYWKGAAQRWKITEKTAKTMLCGNCAAFDASDTMRECIEAGIQGDERNIIVFSPTVSSGMPARYARFANDPNLVNVSVTRSPAFIRITSGSTFFRSAASTCFPAATMSRIRSAFASS